MLITVGSVGTVLVHLAFGHGRPLTVFRCYSSAYCLYSCLSNSKSHSCGAAGYTGLPILLSLVVDRSVVQSARRRLLAYLYRLLLVVVAGSTGLRFGSLGSIHSVLLLFSESHGLPRSHIVALGCTSSVCEPTPVVHSCCTSYLRRFTPALRGRVSCHSCGRSTYQSSFQLYR
jgi:hypothetical protein